MEYKPVRKYGKLVSPQAVKINAGKYAGREGVILDDKSDGYYKVNVTPEEATVQAVDIHEDDFTAIERLSMFTTIAPPNKRFQPNAQAGCLLGFE